jgi:chaperonin cofactor prefoldin
LNKLDEALTDLEMLDEDETLRMKYGDCFFHVKTVHAKEQIEK